jgi:drug/metabolite transporter (DMT)-like permease
VKKAGVHILLFLVNLIYGANYTIAKVVMSGGFIKPFAFIFIRVSLALILFFTVRQVWKREKVDRQDLPRLFLCGLFGVAINQLMFFKGLDFTYPINAALMMITTPILVMIASSFLLKEKIGPIKWIGALIGAAGCAIVITYGKSVELSAETVLGDLFVLINASSYAVYLVMVKPLMRKYHPITVISYVFFFGFFPVAIMGTGEFLQIDWASFTIQAWLGLAYVVIFTTFLAYMFNIIALKNVSASVVGGYIYLQPVLSALVAVLAGADSLNPWKVAGGLVIFLGVYLVTTGGEHFAYKRKV